MKKGFIHTDNYRRLADAQRQVARRGAREAGLVIIQGIFGIGKSELTERWAMDNHAIFVRAKETWTPRGLLDELADAMGLDKRGRNQQVQSRIISKLLLHSAPLLIDEADHLLRSTPRLLEVVRDITDSSGTMCFLVGMERFAFRLARYGHIASRVAQVVEFTALSLADVQATCNQRCECALGPGVVGEIHEQAKGRMRLLLNAISNVEHLARTNGLSCVTLDHIKGKTIVAEFTGKNLGRSGVRQAQAQAQAA